MNDILIAVIPASISAVLTYILTRKKYNAEVNTTELDNVEKSLGIYRKMVEELGQRVDALQKQLDGYVSENENLRRENKALRGRVEQMGREINKLKAQSEHDDSTQQAKPA